MKILVLGGGAQGRVIAEDLARTLHGASVTVVDQAAPELAKLPNLDRVEIDLSSVADIARLMKGYDLAVGALPSPLGHTAMQAAIEAKRNLVDVSFGPENPLALDRDARRAGIAILPDCGLAPGLAHLAAGRAAATDMPDEIAIYVGGVAQDREQPYGWVATSPLEDLEQIYTRPARIIAHGKPATVPVWRAIEHIQIDGVGEMEAFHTDGLRTLLETLPAVPSMIEKTLRWPGHADAVRPLLESGRFVEELRARCVVDEPRDLVVLVVRARHVTHDQRMTLIDRYDRASGLSAMSRTTALTASAVGQLVADGGVAAHGVMPLELIGPDEDAYGFITDRLARHGIQLRWHEASSVW